ncbi:TPA: asparagine synthase [Staphylococcus aureus]|nr:asparagine synthase [Staphylococcus aureus]HDP5870762.1 asparagine synthase [Staphylococcus aureus]HDP5926208.1 asparagine synthase [Staphylococcus aureus]HDP6029068.1 asparagine synthase [Staphylococcus aureus]HDP6109928.1 asparagine synthase [Staphylococcus aureus]
MKYRLENDTYEIDAEERQNFRIEQNYILGIIGTPFIGKEKLTYEDIIKIIQNNSMEKVAGQYCIIFINRKQRKVILYRDPTGLQKIYFSLNNVYEIEIKKSLRLFNLTDIKINHEYVIDYLNSNIYRNCSTGYINIYRAIPGYKIDIDKNSFTVKRYYKFINNPIRYKDRIEYMEHFNYLFEQAIIRNLEDVENLSVSLSGGLDSSSIYSVIQNKELYNKKVNTYSLYYPDDIDSNEIEYIKSVLKEYPSSNHTLIDATSDWTFKNFELYYKNFIEPYHLIGPNLNTMLLKPMHADNITHHITGHAGDHVLNGDYYYLNYLYKNKYYKKLSLEYIKLSKEFSSFELKQAIKNDVKDIKETYFWKKDSLNLEKNFNWDPYEMNRYFDEIISHSGHEWIDININENWNIENRYPFLDINLIEFLLNIPVNEKWNAYSTKVILRESLKDILPFNIYSRKTKATNLSQLLKGLQIEKGRILSHKRFSNLNKIININAKLFEEEVNLLSNSLKDSYYNVINVSKVLSIELWLKNK